MEEIKVELELIETETIKIEFNVQLFITRSMETFEGEY